MVELVKTVLVKIGVPTKRYSYTKELSATPQGWRVATDEEFAEEAIRHINSISTRLSDYGITKEEFDMIVENHAMEYNIPIEEDLPEVAISDIVKPKKTSTKKKKTTRGGQTSLLDNTGSNATGQSASTKE